MCVQRPMGFSPSVGFADSSPIRRSHYMPSSDEEGGKTAGFDGRRDNAHVELQQVLR